jgi:hypothetical protein
MQALHVCLKQQPEDQGSNNSRCIAVPPVATTCAMPSKSKRWGAGSMALLLWLGRFCATHPLSGSLFYSQCHAAPNPHQASDR